jgi:hypothetical protein
MKSQTMCFMALLGSVLLCQCSKKPEVFETPAGYSKPISLQKLKSQDESWQKKALAIMSLAVEPTAHAASTHEELKQKKVVPKGNEKRGRWAPLRLHARSHQKAVQRKRSTRHLTLK